MLLHHLISFASLMGCLMFLNSWQGDFVDRGYNSLEVFTILLLLKARYVSIGMLEFVSDLISPLYTVLYYMQTIFFSHVTSLSLVLLYFMRAVTLSVGPPNITRIYGVQLISVLAGSKLAKY